MNIAVVGSGYVGLVGAACFANIGNRVYAVDNNPQRLETLRKGQVPIFEPGLEQLIASNVAEERLSFHASITEVLPQVEVVFIAVGTPMGEGGAADLSAVRAVASEIGQNLEQPVIVVNKSTVPIGTGDMTREIIQGELEKRGVNLYFSVVSNPEFLKEGKAIQDFSSPDRVVLGSDDAEALRVMSELYRPLVYRNPKERILCMSLRSAELTKYAANAMLATRISFINEISELCEKLGANIHDVREGIGSDERIGSHFLYPGVGYGGSCFPKDVKALQHTFRANGLEASMLDAVEARNAKQKNWLFKQMEQHFDGKLEGLCIALWGLSFKPNTDDVREAPSLTLIAQLLQAGASVRAYDPKGEEQTKFYLQQMAEQGSLQAEHLQRVAYYQHAYQATEGADALALLTEWKEFLNPDWKLLRKHLKNYVLFDGRTQFLAEHVKEQGFMYYAVGLAQGSL